MIPAITSVRTVVLCAFNLNSFSNIIISQERRRHECAFSLASGGYMLIIVVPHDAPLHADGRCRHALNLHKA